MGLYLADGVSTDAVIARVQAIAAGRQTIRAASNSGIREESLRIFDRTFVITDVLYWLALGVAFIGILSAMLALQLERAREFATLRALGMTPAQVGGMITTQTGVIGLLSGLAAIPLGIVMAWVLIKVINRRAFGWQIDMTIDPDILVVVRRVRDRGGTACRSVPGVPGRAKPAGHRDAGGIRCEQRSSVLSHCYSLCLLSQMSAASRRRSYRNYSARMPTQHSPGHLRHVCLRSPLITASTPNFETSGGTSRAISMATIVGASASNSQSFASRSRRPRPPPSPPGARTRCTSRTSPSPMPGMSAFTLRNATHEAQPDSRAHRPSRSASGSTTGRWQSSRRQAGTCRARDAAFGIDLELTPLKPPILNGVAGLSQKSANHGNASYYYSITRLQTEGNLSIGEREYTVSGLSWLDREWSTSALAADQDGWDWFALQLSDGSELMFYGLRKTDGTRDATSSGTFVDADGVASRLNAADVDVTVLDTWASPEGGTYPSRWMLRVPHLNLELTVTPVITDQELFTTVRYWEGAVDVAGEHASQPITGRGYVELTGYAQ